MGVAADQTGARRLVVAHSGVVQVHSRMKMVFAANRTGSGRLAVACVSVAVLAHGGWTDAR